MAVIWLVVKVMSLPSLREMFLQRFGGKCATHITISDIQALPLCCASCVGQVHQMQCNGMHAGGSVLSVLSVRHLELYRKRQLLIVHAPSTSSWAVT